MSTVSGGIGVSLEESIECMYMYMYVLCEFKDTLCGVRLGPDLIREAIGGLGHVPGLWQMCVGHEGGAHYWAKLESSSNIINILQLGIVAVSGVRDRSTAVDPDELATHETPTGSLEVTEEHRKALTQRAQARRRHPRARWRHGSQTARKAPKARWLTRTR